MIPIIKIIVLTSAVCAIAIYCEWQSLFLPFESNQEGGRRDDEGDSRRFRVFFLNRDGERREELVGGGAGGE